MLKITLTPGQKIFITSDTHYNHKNICRGTTEWDLVARGDNSITRDFKTLSEMNDAIVNGINEEVRENDILIHLGDWSFGGFDSIKEFRDRIVCKNIHIITGNHDHHIENDRDGIRSIFSSVHEKLTTLELKYPSLSKNGELETITMILCHFPICSWENMNRGWVHLFGHVHLSPSKCMMQGRSMDIGVDGNDMKPLNLVVIERILSRRPVLPSVLPSDHHSKPVSSDIKLAGIRYLD